MSRNVITIPSQHSRSYPVIEYLHLTSLDVTRCHEDYLDQFLNETKAYIPCLTKLSVSASELKKVTKDFTKETTRRNCANLKELLIDPMIDLTEHSHYFPSLEMCL